MEKLSKIDRFLKNYTFLLFGTAFLGVHIISINLGYLQLSPYRILLLLSPILLSRIKRRTFNQLRNSKNYRYFVFLFFWALYSFLPLLWVQDFQAWLKIYIFLLSGLITTWLIGFFFTSKEDIIKALIIIELLSVVFGIIGVYEILSGNYMFLNQQSLDFYQERSQLSSTIGFRVPISIFGNPNNYALFLLFAIFASFALSKVKPTGIGRSLSFLLTIVFIFLLISTQSRSGFIGLLIGFSFYGIITWLRTPGIKAFLLTIIAVFFIIIFLVPVLSNNQGIYQSLVEVDFGSSGSDYIRVNLIKNGFHFLENTFFAGVGLGNIEYHMQHKGIYLTEGITNIHNWWMEVLVSSGILVFVFYIVVYAKGLIHLYKVSIKKSEKVLIHIASAFFCFLTAFFITSVGASSLMYNEWIWPVMALIMSFVNVFYYHQQNNT